YNLRVDPSENFNIATNHPAVLSQITQAVERHRATLTPAQSQLVEFAPLPEKR
ncbi:MAG: hypothetical protein EB082_18190, partial [Verrucomicrobia bacterium]|nr:hypothetical protein [Verrucomicrobiota bacterium]